MTISKTVWKEIVWQRPFELEAVHDVLSHLASLTSRGFIFWEARCRDGKIRYLVGTSAKSVSRVQEVFSAHGEMSFLDTPQRKPVGEARQLKISHPVLSLNTGVVASMTRATLAAMSGAKQGEEAVVQVVLGAPLHPCGIPKNMQNPNATFIDIVRGKAADATPEQRKSASEKSSQFGFECTVRIGVSGSHATSRIYNIISAIKTLESAGVHIKAVGEESCNLNNAAVPWRLPLRLSVKEVAAMMLLPAGEDDLPSVPGMHPKQIWSPKWYKEPKTGKQDRTFAVSMEQQPKKLSISPNDSLEHTVLLGPTGSGKSAAMLRLILADVHAGKSVLVIDPKDLVLSILERIPEERADDVVVISPADVCPVGFNPLALRQDPSLTADTILATFSQVWAENWGIRTADVLAASLNTLVRIPGSTLLWLTPLLTDVDFRKRIVSKIKDPIGLEPFWRHYEEMRDSERRTEIAPVLNKLRQITMRPGLRNVLGQPEPKFYLGELFTKRRIVLVPLNKGIIGAESAKLLGSLIVGLTWSLTLSRAEIPPEKRHIVSIYIDELQDYLAAIPSSFSDALAMARGLHVGYSFAHQFRAQLSPVVRAAVDANARNKIIFGLNSDDAKDMAAQAPELTALDFMTLPRYQVYTKFQYSGRNTGWISGKTLPPPEPLRMAADLHARSAQRYGCNPETIERELMKIIRPESFKPGPEVQSTPIGRKKRS